MKGRDKLTFSQAEGLEPLPAPLKLRELPRELRNALCNVLIRHIKNDTNKVTTSLEGDWLRLLVRKHTTFDHRPSDEFSGYAPIAIQAIKAFLFTQPYNRVFDLLEFLVRNSRDAELAEDLNSALEEQQAAYRFIDLSVMPVATEEEGAALRRAFESLSTGEFGGARSHLRAAGAALARQGQGADSVRESIHAVESVVRALTGKPKATLSDGLARLRKSAPIHPVLENAFQKLYAYTNDEQGVRHALNEKDARVDEADALFMLGAAASFITYVIGKARLAGLQFTSDTNP